MDRSARLFIKIIVLILIIVFTVNLTGCMKNKIRPPFLELCPILGDNMVLQQNTHVNIWGWTHPSQKVVIDPEWTKQSYQVQSDKNGKWIAKILTGHAGGPYQLAIHAGKTHVLKNIMLGEVWLCSGQSNMQWTLAKAESADTEIPKTNYPDIRLFTVEQRVAPMPETSCRGKWQECSAQSAGGFSAVAYFFGKDLHLNQNVPIGLINASWGGTTAEAWMSKNELVKFEEFQSVLDTLYNDQEKFQNRVLAYNQADSMQKMMSKMMDFEEPDNIGKSEKWFLQNFDDSQWKKVHCPEEWMATDSLYRLKGVVWARKKIEIPHSWVGQELVIELGPLDEMDETYINGILIGSNQILDLWNQPRCYTVPANTVKTKDVTIAIRLLNTIAEGGFIGKPTEMKIYPSHIKDKSMSLAGNWKYKIAFTNVEAPFQASHRTPSYLFNGMISPIIQMTLKGVIWYQGEANVPKAKQYRRIFPSLISDWRCHWNQGDFPFYFVQLPPFEYDIPNSAAELRQAQLFTLLSVSNTGMVTTMDIGNPLDIHPTNKRDVGYRLALWALAGCYGHEIVYSGPLYKNNEVKQGKVYIEFDHIGSGLLIRNNQQECFEISGQDSIFYTAQTEIANNKIVVWNEAVHDPMNVRYAWGNAVIPSLFNKEGLPASPFNISISDSVQEELE